MKLTVIGCWHGYPEPEEATAGYLIQKDGFSLLIDCGSGVMSHIQSYCPVESINAVIVSHYHQDHIADIGVLHYATMMNTFLGKTTEKLVIYGHMLDQEKYNKLAYEPYVSAIPYTPEKPLQIGPFYITFLKTKHPAPCCAMRINDENNTIIYTADTEWFPELATFAEHADLLIAECSFYKEQEPPPGGHMNSTNVGKLAEQSQAKELLLTHLPHFGNRELLLQEAQAEYKGPLQLAKKGWTKSF